MRFGMFRNLLGLCSVLFCLSDGSPPKAESSHKGNHPLRGRKIAPPYTIEEENFIFSQVAACTDPYSLRTWAAIGKAHKAERERGTKGFDTDRKQHALRVHFFRYMVRKDAQNKYSNRVPDAVKKALQSKRYTQEEDDLIKTELLLRKYTDCNRRALWKEIKTKHDQLRGSNIPGFANKRTAEALRKHFNVYLKSHFLEQYGEQLESANIALETKYDGSPKDTSQAKNQSSEEDEAIHESEEENDEDLEEIAEAMLALK